MNSRGIGLTELLIGMGIGIVVLAGVADISVGLTQLHTLAETENEAESLVGLIQDHLNNPTICALALQPGTSPQTPPRKLVWDRAAPLADSSAFGLIQYGGASGPYLGYDGALFNANGSTAGTIASMTSFLLRLPDPRYYESSPTSTDVQRFNSATQAYETITFVNAKLVFQFKSPTPVLGVKMNLPDRVIDLVAGFDAGNQLVTCATANQIPTQSVSASSVPGGLGVCPAKPPGCEQLHYINGFDASGTPTYQCSITCPNPPTGPPGTYTPPVVVDDGSGGNCVSAKGNCSGGDDESGGTSGGDDGGGGGDDH